MEIMKVLGLLLVVATVSTAKQLKFNDCGSKGAEIKSINVSPCESDPCVLHKGGSYTTNVTFTANEKTSTISTKAYLIVKGKQYDFPISKDGCQTKIVPIEAGETKSMVCPFKVNEKTPTADFVFKWIMRGENKKVFFCYMMPLSIR